MRLLLSALLVSCAVLAACVPSIPIARGTPFAGLVAPPPGTARIYVLRPNFAGQRNAEPEKVMLDGVLGGVLEPDQFTDFVVAPGRHIFALREARQEQTLNAEAGATYFLAFWAMTEGFGDTVLVPIMGIPVPMGTSVHARVHSTEMQWINEGEAVPALGALKRPTP